MPPLPIYEAETDEQAVNEAREHIEALFNIFLPKQSELMFIPPGYMLPESLKRALASKRGSHGGVKIENLIERGIGFRKRRGSAGVLLARDLTAYFATMDRALL